MKKLAACLAVLLLGCSLLAVPAGAVGFTSTYTPAAEAAYIVNLDTNIIVYEKNSETPLAAASLTKLMTVLLLLETYGDDLDTPTATLTYEHTNYLYGKNASSADIRQGETHTMRTLLYCMLLPSANEAAMMVADAIGGSQSNFVYMMNARAKELGCTGTTFTDCCGLDPNNLTTARDMYLILRALLNYDLFKEIIRLERWDVPAAAKHPEPYMILTTNLTIRPNAGAEFYRSYSQGGKTGSLEDWKNYAGWHSQDGASYISVVLHSPNSCDQWGIKYTNDDGSYKYNPALYETDMLMDWVFDSFSIQAALDTQQPIEEVKVKYSAQTDTLLLYPADDLQTLLPKDGDGTETQRVFDLPESVAAPVKQGDVVGTVTVSLSGQVLGTVELLAGSDVERSELLFIAAKVGEFFSSRYFKVVLVLSILAFVGYLGVWVTITVQDKRKNRNKIRRRY